jgi:predicted ATP-grasp superfamily ATP-dependent carboligase
MRNLDDEQLSLGEPNNFMVKVLVTYGWCRTAYLSVRALTALGHQVYSCSHLQPSMSAWSRFCCGSALVSNPFEMPIAFTKDISNLVDRWNIDIVLPCHEDALVLREQQKYLPQLVKVASAEIGSLRLGLNKRSITEIAQSVGVSVPNTIFPNTLEEAFELAPSLGFPLVIKLTRSNSAKGVFIVKTEEELKSRLLEACTNSKDKFLGDFLYLQAFHHGSVVGGCFMARNGNIDGYFGERYLRTKTGTMGTSVFREPFESSNLQSRVTSMVKALSWTGIGHFDFIEDSHTGDFLLLEMNPRPWGAINLAYVNGFDFIGALVAHTLNEQELKVFFRSRPRQSLRSMWILGEAIRLAYILSTGQFGIGFSTVFTTLKSLRHTRFDDFLWHDPLPFLAESLCYAKGFLHSNKNFNPA